MRAPQKESQKNTTPQGDSEKSQKERQTNAKEMSRLLRAFGQGWVDSLPRQKEKRRQAIVSRFPIGEDFICYDNGFPADDFCVKSVRVAEDCDDDRITIEHNGDVEMLSLYALDNLVIEKGFAKASQKKSNKTKKQKTRKASVGKKDEERLKRQVCAIGKIEEIFSDAARNRYHALCKNCDEKVMTKHMAAFEDARGQVLQEVHKVMCDATIDDVGVFVNNFLAKDDKYSKIKKAITKQNNNHTSMNPEQMYNLGVQKTRIDNGDANNKDVTDKEFLGTRNDEEDRLEKESQRRQDANNKDVTDKEFLGTRNDEEDRLEKESQRRQGVGLGDSVDSSNEQKEQENHDAQEDRAQQESEDEKENMLEELQRALDDARAVFAKKNYKNNNVLAYLQKKIGIKQLDQHDAEMQTFKNDYQTALQNYREARLAEAENMTDAERVALAKELFIFNSEEAARLEDGYTQAKAEETSGGAAFLGKVGNAVGRFAKSKVGKTALTAASLITVSGAVRKVVSTQSPKILMKLGITEKTATVIGSGVVKFLTPMGAGLAAGAATEYVQRKIYERREENEKRSFEQLSVEEQIAHLQNFNQASFDKLMHNMNARVNRRRISVVAGGIATAAAFMVTGELGAEEVSEIENPTPTAAAIPEGMPRTNDYSFDSVTSQYSGKFTAAMMDTDAFKEFKEKYGPQAHAQYLTEHGGDEKAELAWQRNVRSEANRYEFLARKELQGKGVSEFAAPSETEGKTPTAAVEAKNASSGNNQQSSEDGSGKQESAVGAVNADILKEQASKVWESDINQAIPKVEDGVYSDVSLENHKESIVDAVDNSAFQGIEMHEGIGTLTIERGGSIEGALIAFFVDNKDQLTEGGMGWDPDKYSSVEEWAGKRAHGLVEEYMSEDGHAGIDLNTVQPGTTFTIDLNNPGNIQIKKIDFEGGPHIVPEAEKVVVPSMPEAQAGVAGVAINTPESVMNTFNFGSERYSYFSETPAEQYIQEVQAKAPADRIPVDTFLLDLAEKGSMDFAGKTVAEVLASSHIDAVSEQVPPNGSSVIEEYTVEQTKTAEEVDREMAVERLAAEKEYIKTMMQNPRFVVAVRKCVENLTDNAHASEIASIPLTQMNDVYPDALDEMIKLSAVANVYLEDSVIVPLEKGTVGTYMTRLFARAVREGKVKDIFPSSTFIE